MNNITEILDKITISKSSAYLSLEVIIILAATFLLSFIFSQGLNKLNKVSKHTKTIWDDVFYRSLSGPGQLLIYVLGVFLALEVANQELKLEFIKMLKPLKTIIIILSLLWVVLNIISGLEDHWHNLIRDKKTKLDKTSVSAIVKLLRATGIVVATLMGLESMGFNISGLIAFGGASGIAVGFAAKDLLANFFGAVMIYFDRPFKIGEWIRIPEKDIEGYVEKIGARCTVIKTLDKRPLYVPNSIFSHASIENPSRMSHRRVYETIGLRYEDLHVVDKIIKRIESFFKNHPKVDNNLPLVVNLHGFCPTSINIMIYAFVTEIEMMDFYKVKQELMLAIARIVEEFEAEMAQYSTTFTVPEEFYKEAGNSKKTS